VFFALYGRVSFLWWPKKRYQKKGHPHACPSGSLRCSNKLAGCETRYRSDNTPRNPQLILCFSASLNGIKSFSPRGRASHNKADTIIIFRLFCGRRALAANEDKESSKVKDENASSTPLSRVWSLSFCVGLWSLAFDLQPPFGLSSTGKLGRNSTVHVWGRSPSSPCPVQTEARRVSRRPTRWGRVSLATFFIRIKKVTRPWRAKNLAEC